MTVSCEGLGFTEIVKCEIENGRHIAQGYAQCHIETGRGGHSDLYTMPSGWEYDPRYVSKYAGVGTHGGCKYCNMALLHLRKILREPPSPTPTPTPTPPVDPCEHVVCPAKCAGVDKYAQTCQNGVCVRGRLLEANSVDCGYEKPYPTPTPTTDTYIYAIIALMIVGTYIMLRR